MEDLPLQHRPCQGQSVLHLPGGRDFTASWLVVTQLQDFESASSRSLLVPIAIGQVPKETDFDGSEAEMSPIEARLSGCPLTSRRMQTAPRKGCGLG